MNYIITHNHTLYNEVGTLKSAMKIVDYLAKNTDKTIKVWKVYNGTAINFRLVYTNK